MSLEQAIGLVALGGIIALAYAAYKAKWIYRQPVENETLKRISGYVSEGAMTFISREYKVLFPFVLIVAAFLFLGNLSNGYLRWQSLAFILGAGCSALAGYFRYEGGHRIQLPYDAGSTNGYQWSSSGGILRRQRDGDVCVRSGAGRHCDRLLHQPSGSWLGSVHVEDKYASDSRGAFLWERPPLRCLREWVAGSLPRRLMSVPTSWEKSRREFRRMTLVIRRPSRITSGTMSVMSPVWAPICLSPMSVL